MQREQWKFDYTATKLSAATQAKIAYHEQQLDFWKACCRRRKSAQLWRQEMAA